MLRQWLIILIGLIVLYIASLVRDRYKRLLSYEDEKVDELWNLLKKNYLDSLDKLCEGLTYVEIDQIIKDTHSEHPSRKEIIRLSKDVSKWLRSSRKTRGRTFMRKLYAREYGWKLLRFEK